MLERPVIVDSGSQVTPHREGQFITFTCPHGFVLTGPNTSVCTGNGRWEPDPGEVDCIGGYANNGVLCIGCIRNAADCGVPQLDRNVTLNYISTLEGSVVILTCENNTATDEQILYVTCQRSGNWIPDPTQFTCSEFTTVPSGTEILIHSSPDPRSNSGNKINIYHTTRFYYCRNDVYTII
jgi:hypothetical protein